MSDFYLHFDDTTRNRLSALLLEALKDRDLPLEEAEFETRVMLGIMESYAAAIPLYKELNPESQQRRRERIESLAAHIEGAIEQLNKLDSAALGFVVSKGFEAASSANGIQNIFPESFANTLEACAWREENTRMMSDFALGVRKAAKELPQHSMKTSGKTSPWYLLPKELSTAMAIEGLLFWDYKIKFTTSSGGLAAECLRAVYSLGGLEIDRVDYWLKQAKNHPDSWHSFAERLQKRTDE